MERLIDDEDIDGDIVNLDLDIDLRNYQFIGIYCHTNHISGNCIYIIQCIY